MSRRRSRRPGRRLTVTSGVRINGVPAIPRPSSTARAGRLDLPDIPDLVERLFEASRTHPIVAVTTSASTGDPHLDPDQLAGLLADRAQVLVLQPGETTSALSEAMPEKLDVYGGAVRIWWPGLSHPSPELVACRFEQLLAAG